MDLWLADPVTQAYKTCLDTTVELIDSQLAKGSDIDFSNNDLSMNKISQMMGSKEMMISMSKFQSVLSVAAMIEAPKNEG